MDNKIGRNVEKIEIDYEATGHRIKELMELKGISAKDLSGVLNVSFQAVYKWQRGEALPTINNLFLLSQLLDTDMEDMLVSKEN